MKSNLELQFEDIKKSFQKQITSREGRNSILKTVDEFVDFTKLSYDYTKNLFPDEEKALFLELVNYYISILDDLETARHPIPKRIRKAYLFFKEIERRGI